ncbi:MAG: radical SAM protein [Deltaproteobacteria bacterium]|nr:radical SAM protein [Deltaproteobacteria bacterium]
MHERFHILSGPTCNNNCVFCMEDDRVKRMQLHARITPRRVLDSLRAHAADGDVMFTSGEPTLNPNLPVYVRWARQLGYRTIGLTTNARRLGYEPYTRELLGEGLNLVVVSIHGPDARCHDGQTRTPRSFEQTMAGLATLARLKGEGSFRVQTSTVVGQRNCRRLAELYRLLEPHRIDEYVFNVMQPLGRAGKLVEQLVARYRDIAAEFRRFLDTVPAPRPAIYLVDLPLCTTEGLPAEVRGYVELAKFDEPGKDGVVRLQATRVTKEEKNRVKRAECDRCSYSRACLGVWRTYLDAYGWDEFVPVTSAPASGRRPGAQE